MPRKSHTLRALDQSNPNAALLPAPDESTSSLGPPLSPSAMEPPDNLALVAALARSAGTPTTLISATWDAPTGVVVDKYTVQWSTDSAFPDATTESADTFRAGATINGLIPLTLYYVRVSAWEHGVQSQWSSMLPLVTGQNRVTTPADTVAPLVPTGASAAFVNAGDLRIVWTEPPLLTSPNFRDVEIRIWDSAAKGVQYLLDYSATEQYVFTAAQNGRVTSYVFDPSLYVELRARSWGNQFSTAVVVGTITKAVPANPVMTATWDGATGSLILDWTDIVDAASYELTLDGKLYPSATSKLVYDVARNRADHAGTPDPAITYLLKSVDRLAQHSTGVTATVTLARPATPSGLTSSWAADAGLAGPDCSISWTAQASIAFHRPTIDGAAYDQIATQRIYTLDNNRSGHSGTPDPVLTISLVAVDGLGQTSVTPATLTATNAAPPTTAITIAAGFSVVAAAATPSAAADFRDYTFRVIKDTVTLATYRSTSPDQLYKATASGSYQIGVIVNDLFGQASSETVSSAVVLDALTIEELRAETTYTDSAGNTSAALSVLKDGDLAGTPVTYGASATPWLWTEAMRPLLDRYKTISVHIGTIAAGSLRFYVGISSDGVTWAWYSGPFVASGATGQSTTLTARASEALAQTNALTATANTSYRLDLPALTEARFVRLGHRNTTGAYNLHEFYPRRLTQSDDADFEFLRSINIGAGQVLADHISVISLAAIVVDTGALNISGVMSIGAAGGIYQGSGTFASPTTGLKLYAVSGVGRLAGYNAGVEQVAIDTDGRMKAAGGAIILDATGIDFDFTAAGINTGYVYIDWKASGIYKASLGAENLVGYNQLILNAYNSAGSAVDVSILLRADKSTPANSNIQFEIDGYNSTSITKSGIVTDDITALGGLNLGTATGAAVGALKLSGSITAGSAILSDGANAGFIFEDRTGSESWQWFGSGSTATLYNGAANVITISPTSALNLIGAARSLNMNGTKVVGNRVTGWGTPSGTLSRVAINNATSQVVFNQTIMAIVTDMIAHGLFGA